MSQDFEQKLIAVLFADVVGYSRLSSEDELATHRTLKDYLNILTGIIEEHGGSVVNYAGDALLAKFDSVSGALSSAVVMQQELKGRNERLPVNRRLVFRVGINLGEVIVDHDDIFGGGVNVAARLEGLADPGGICMSGSVYDAIGHKLGYRYEYMGEQKVKNIEQPVRSYRVIADDKTPINKEPPPARNRARYLSIGLVLLSIIGLLLYSFITWQQKSGSKNNETTTQIISESASTGPSIAVLPFSNLSGETEQEYFSDGITNDIITDLSQLSNLLVIASNSVFVYKNTPVKVQQVAAELGVTHVLEGSVQKSGQRIRINAQLIDAATGHHMWAERFDRDLIEIFALQDEVSKKIVKALAIELTNDEQQRLDKSREVDPQAYDLLLKGLELFRRFTGETNMEARDYFQRAIEIDPGFARAYADVALSHAIDVQFGWVKITPEKFAVAFEYAEKALNLDDTLGPVHFAISMLHLASKEYDKAIESSRQSITLHPNYADGHAQYALLLTYAGEPLEALEKLGVAVKLNPRPAFFYTWIEGRAHMLLGHYEQAESLFLNVIERNAHFLGAHLTLASMYGNLGRIEDAQWEASEILALQPDFSLRIEAQNIPFKKQEHQDFYINGLRKAGLPE